MTERKRGPGEQESPAPVRSPGKHDRGDADDISYPFPALDPPDDWPDPEPPVYVPERELA